MAVAMDGGQRVDRSSSRRPSFVPYPGAFALLAGYNRMRVGEAPVRIASRHDGTGRDL